MTPELIFWPMIIVALATIAIYPKMLAVRIGGVRSGKVKPKVYKLNNGEPEDSARLNNAIKNQYESPVLFYAVCLAAYVSSNTDGVLIVLAFVFATFKVLHILIHTTTNWVPHRLGAFASALLVLALMWIWFALKLADFA